jgi:hypothetical protein
MSTQIFPNGKRPYLFGIMPTTKFVSLFRISSLLEQDEGAESGAGSKDINISINISH